MHERQIRSLDLEDPLEREMSTSSSTLGNPRDRGAWWATVPGVAKSFLPLMGVSVSIR